MKKIISLVLIFFVFAGTVISTGCARQPSTKKTTAIMEKYFKKYGKEYPESMFGQYPVKSIDILHIEEVHKDFIAAYAIMELEGGMAVQTRFTIENKAPFGWKANSWENMGMANFQQQQ